MTSTRKVVSVLGRSTGPSLDLNFINGRPLDARIAFSRSSVANFYDATGTLQQAAANVPRIDYGPTPGGVTNLEPNGQLPIYTGSARFSYASSTDVPPPFAGSTVRKITDVTGSGDNNSGANVGFTLSGGQAYTASCSVWVPASFTGSVLGFASPAGFSAGTATNADLTKRDQWQRMSWTGTWTTGGGSPGWVLRPVTNLNDFFYFTAMQYEAGSVAHAYVPTSGGPANVGATPLGLLIEEQRTNSIRNPRCEGAVAGTPGTLPTNWLVTGVPTGASLQVVGSGTEAGIPYVDLRFFGTPTASAPIGIFAEGAGSIAAANGQTWAESQYIRVVGGSLSGLDTVEFRIRFNNSSGTPLADAVGTLATPTNAGLATQRVIYARTASDATTGYVQPYIRVGTISGSAFDVTLRIGLPQLEIGTFASSPMLPPAGSPAAFTRATDVATMPVGAWFNAAAGTLKAQGLLLATMPASAVVGGPVAIHDGTVQNRIIIYNELGTNGVDVFAEVAGAVVLNQRVGMMTPGVPFKAAVSYSRAGYVGAVGGALGTPVAGAIPSGLASLRIGAINPASNLMNGYVQWVQGWRRALSNSELIADST